MWPPIEKEEEPDSIPLPDLSLTLEEQNEARSSLLPMYDETDTLMQLHSLLV